MFWKVVAGIVGGLIVAALAGNIVNLVSSSTAASAVLLLSWAAAIVGALKASRAGVAWRWLLVASAALSFTVPLASLVWTTEQTTGTDVAGGLVATGFFAVVFFLLGLAFLVVGLLVGRDKKEH
jgi:hypothetical protein